MIRRTTFLISTMLCCVIAGCSDDAASTPAADSGAVDTGTSTDTGSPVDSGGADTGSATDSGAADGSGADSGSDAGGAPTCEAYCSAVTTNCVGSRNTQYIDKARCLSMCAKMTVGTLADTNVDTLGCRMANATAAKDSPDLSCPKAGATGGGACGPSRCDAFCKLAIAQCPSGAPFTTEAACQTQCAAAAFNGSLGEIEMAAQTLNCMQYHLQAAYQSSAAATVHCPHLTVSSGPCGPV